MKRTVLPLLTPLVLLAVGAAACGDDTVDPGSAPSTLPDVPDTGVPPTDPNTPPATGPTDGTGYEHPTGADEVVFEYAELGGFLPRELAFQATPSILISGDGRMFVPGPQIMIYPGPLLPNILVRSISEDGIQQILAAADAAGLFADVDYSADLNIADASTATVTINVDGETWVHEAYALGVGPGGPGAEVTPERQALIRFLNALQAGELYDADAVGPEQSFAPDAYLIEALVVEDLSVYGADVEPTVVDWPAEASVRLADAARCVAVPAAEVGEALMAANQLTFFEDGGVVYQVNVRPQLPGAECAG